MDRKWQIYRAADDHDYAIFRESVAATSYPPPGTVLEVGFRLKLIRSSQIMHWIFQRLCIFTTPFWSGFDGFVVKLWMVNPQTKSYLGIYQWTTPDRAQWYVDALTRVLRAVSTPGSVWHKIHPDTDLDAFLRQHQGAKP
jgi:hypothetical protein